MLVPVSSLLCVVLSLSAVTAQVPVPVREIAEGVLMPFINLGHVRPRPPASIMQGGGLRDHARGRRQLPLPRLPQPDDGSNETTSAEEWLALGGRGRLASRQPNAGHISSGWHDELPVLRLAMPSFLRSLPSFIA
jgi:hypothetical protein